MLVEGDGERRMETVLREGEGKSGWMDVGGGEVAKFNPTHRKLLSILSILSDYLTCTTKPQVTSNIKDR